MAPRNRMPKKDLRGANAFTFIFLVFLFAVFYSRATYNNDHERNEKRHLDEQRHLKASKALKYGSKAVAANYGKSDYPSNDLKTKMDPYALANDYGGDPRVALRRRMAMRLVKQVLTVHIRGLLRDMEKLYIKKEKMKMRALHYLRMYAIKLLCKCKKYSKIEIFFKRLEKRMYSNSVQVQLGKMRNRKKTLYRNMKLRSLRTVKWMFVAKRKSYKKMLK